MNAMSSTILSALAPKPGKMSCHFKLAHRIGNPKVHIPGVPLECDTNHEDTMIGKEGPIISPTVVISVLIPDL